LNRYAPLITVPEPLLRRQFAGDVRSGGLAMYPEIDVDSHITE